MTDVHSITFSGLTSGQGPLTWGQRHIGRVLAANEHGTEQYTLRRCWPVPPGTRTAEVHDALRGLVARHEALRTRLVDDVLQRTCGEGHITVEHHESTDGQWSADDALRAADRLSGEQFDLAAEFPVRFQILSVEGRPEWVVMALSHMAGDAYACDLLQGDFERMLRADGLLPTTSQPVTWALYEQSARGARVNRRSVDYMCTLLREYGDPLFPSTAPADHRSRGFPVVRGHGYGVGARVEGLASRWRLSATAVSLAALARSFARHSGLDAFPLGVTSSNRFLPGAERYLGTMAQNNALGVHGATDSLHDVATTVERALMAALPRSSYDQDTLRRALQESGTDFDHVGFGPVGHFVNFMRTGAPISRQQNIGTDDARVSVTEAPPVEQRLSRFGVIIRSDGEDMDVRMFADATAIPVELAKSVVGDLLEELAPARRGNTWNSPTYRR